MATQRRHLAFVIACGMAGLAAWQGPVLVAHWRADRTARQMAEAMYFGDSIRLVRLSATGSARNLLCVRRLWPSEFWMHRNGAPLAASRSRPYGEAFGYRMLGEPLPDNQHPAVFEFYIRRDRPTKVASFFADARTGVWNGTVRACMGQAPVSGLIR
jgi:hypothetical protein